MIVFRKSCLSRVFSKKWTSDFASPFKFIFIVCHLFCSFGSCQEISEEFVDRYAVVGSPLWWTCRGDTGTPAVTVTSYVWRKQNVVLVADDNLVVFDNGTIYLKQVKETDLGEYSCLVVTNAQTNNIVEKKAQLLKAYASDTISIQPEDQTVFFGGMAVLECRFQAQPPAAISWKRNNRTLTSSDRVRITQSFPDLSMIRITSATYTDDGHYTCAADHVTLGSPIQSDAMQVRVYGKPMILIPPKSQRVPTGYSATLSCEVQSSPQSSVTWSFTPSSTDNESSDVPLTALTASVSVDEQTGEMFIENASALESGTYTCNWTNEYGSDSAEASLDVEGEPSIPTVIVPPQNKVLREGEYLQLKCQGQGNPDPYTAWIHPSGHILDPQGASDISEIPEDLSPWSVDVEGTLTISSVTRFDTGLFTCRLSNLEGVDRASAFVDVHFEPVFDDAPQSLTVGIDSEISLPCSARGNPEPVISWSVPEDSPSEESEPEFVVENGILTVARAKRKHHGTFTCVASNVVKTIESAAFVSVVGPPEFSELPKSQAVVEGDSVRLDCEISSYPDATVEWFHMYMVDLSLQSTDIVYIKSSLLVAEENVFEEMWTLVLIDENPRFSYVDGHSLSIVNSEQTDAGIYVCKANNSEGWRFEAAVLRVLTFPTFDVQPVTQRVQKGQTAVLECYSMGVPVPSQRWLFNQGKLYYSNRINQDNNGSLIIQDFTTTDVGLYTCLATNQAGQRSVSARLEMSSIPTLITPPTNTTAASGSPMFFLCRGDGAAPFQVSWYDSDAQGTTLTLLGRTSISVPTSREHNAGTTDTNSSGTRVSVNENGDLVFSCVEPSDAGWYVCSLHNNASTVLSEPAYLTTHGHPFVEDLTPPLSSILSGSILALTCVASGLNDLNISWISPSGAEVTTDTDTDLDLTLTEVVEGSGVFRSSISGRANAKLHAGQWGCKACNAVGCSLNKTSVIIEGTPAIVEVVSSESQQGETSVTCTTFSFPEPSVSYSIGNQIIGTSTAGHRVSGGTLYIQRGMLQQGPYSCTATNQIGSVSHQFTVPSTATLGSIVSSSTGVEVDVFSSTQNPGLLLKKASLEYKVENSNSPWQQVETPFSKPIEDYLDSYQNIISAGTNFCSEPTRRRRDTGGDPGSLDPSGDTPDVSITSQGGQLAYRFKLHANQLKPYTTYELRARVSNVLGYSDYSSISTIRTLPGAPAPVTELDVYVENRTASVSWKSPDELGADPIDVMVTVALLDSDDNLVEEAFIGSEAEPIATFRDLSLGLHTVQAFSVNTKNKEQSDVTSLTFSIDMEPPTFIPVLGVISPPDAYSLNITWSLPGEEDQGDLDPPITGYILEIGSESETLGTERQQSVHSVQGAGTSFLVVTSLREHHQYWIRVASKNDGGRGPFSPSVSVSTPYDHFSNLALKKSGVGSLSWRLFAVVMIIVCSALIILITAIVLTYQIKLSKSKSVDLTPEQSRGRGSDRESPRAERRLQGVENRNFTLY